MAENSKIEWTDHTFNPWVGCTKISVGPQGACERCYAEGWAKRTGHPELWAGYRRRTSESNWKQPLKWNTAANARTPRVFCASLADVFDNAVPREWRWDLFRLILQTPDLDWLLLTKRIGNATEMLPVDWQDGYKNVWLGATIANHREMWRDAAKLKATPARIHFWSVEPMLGDLGDIPLELLPDWVICGGESGPRARPLELEWVMRLREQCKVAGVAFFMKQGSQANWPDFKDFSRFAPEVRVREFPEAA